MTGNIAYHKKIQSQYFLLRAHSPDIAATAKPGQFVMIKVSSENTTDPLLRRPLSIMSAEPESGIIEMIYKIAGRGTALLSNKKTGQNLDIIGPLGNGFPELPQSHSALVVGGGVGIPPLIFLTQRLCQRDNVAVTAFIGAKTGQDIVCPERFLINGAENVLCATENGDTGVKGFVTEALNDFLNKHSVDTPVIYACGPEQMLKAVARIGKSRSIPTFVSLEEHMGCGVGACLGCVVDTVNGYKTVCSDGPVFNTADLKSWI